MKKMIKSLLGTAVFSVLIAGVYPVSAHHSTTMFDKDKVILLEGVVKELHWTNPHVAIFIDNGVGKPGVPDGLWVVELTSPSSLTRSGWSRSTVKPGEKVTVEVHPLRDGTKGGGLRKITFAGGKSCTYNIRDQERPNLEGDSLCK